MDRRALRALIARSALALSIIGCASQPGATRTAGPVLSSGALGYHATFYGDRVIAVELRERFALSAYRSSGGPPLWRRDLGPPDYDITGISASKRAVWVTSRDGSVRAFRATDGRPLHGWNLGASATSVATTSTGLGDYLLTGTASGVLCLRRIRDGALLHCVVAHRGAITDLSVADIGSVPHVASASTDGTVSVWRVPSMHRVRRTQLSGSVNAIALAPDGTVAAGTWTGPLIRTPSIARAEREQPAAPDPDAALIIWPPGRAPTRRLGHRGPITDLAWTNAGGIVSASWDRTVRYWPDGASRGRVVLRTNHLVHGIATREDRWVACSWAQRYDQPSMQIFHIAEPAPIDESAGSSLE